MRDNECIIYVEPNKEISYYDMFILNFLRFELEETEEQFGFIKEDILNKLNNVNSFEYGQKIDLIKKVDDNLYNTNDDFLSDKRFVSISRMVSICIYENIILKYKFKLSNIILGVYVYFSSKLKGRAFNNLSDEFYFSYKQLCRNLGLSYNKSSIDLLKASLYILEELELIAYQEANYNNYRMPFILNGVAYSRPGRISTGKDLIRFFNR